jgi:hypothetical protein
MFTVHHFIHPFSHTYNMLLDMTLFYLRYEETRKGVRERGLLVLLLKDSSEASSLASLPSLQGKG